MAIRTVVPEKHYVGMVKRIGDELPLGFMTPWGEDAAAKKRMATVDTWARQSNYYNTSTKVEAQIIDNTPLSGFKFTSSIRNSGYGGHDKWRIEDPRGFELEITSGNLATLMSVGMIDRGEINDQCVWGRQGANNILLSTATDEYKKAVNNTQVFNASASWVDVKLGDTVTLQNTITGVWLGRQYPIYSDRWGKEAALGPNEINHDTKMMHVIYVEGGASSSYQEQTDALHLISNPKLSSIQASKSPLTRSQAELLANQYLTSNLTELVSTSTKTLLAMSFGKAKFTLDKVPLLVSNTVELAEMVHYDCDNVYITLKDGNFGLVKKVNHWGKNAHGYDIILYDIVSLANNELRTRYVYRNDRYCCGYQPDHIEYNFNSIDNFCNLQLTATTAEGNIIQHMIR